MPKVAEQTIMVDAIVWVRDDSGGYLPSPIDRYFLRGCPIAVEELGPELVKYLISSGDAFKKVKVTEKEIQDARVIIAEHIDFLEGEKVNNN